MNKNYKKNYKKINKNKNMEHARYHPSITKYTYRIEYVEKLPRKKNYVDARECTMAGLRESQIR